MASAPGRHPVDEDLGVPADMVRGAVKKVLLVTLVVLLVVIGLPMVMPGIGAAHCDDCTLGVAVGALCLLAVLTAVASLAVFASQRLRVRRKLVPGLLRATLFDPPPQLA